MGIFRSCLEHIIRGLRTTVRDSSTVYSFDRSTERHRMLRVTTAAIRIRSRSKSGPVHQTAPCRTLLLRAAMSNLDSHDQKKAITDCQMAIPS